MAFEQPEEHDEAGAFLSHATGGVASALGTLHGAPSRQQRVRLKEHKIRNDYGPK